MKKDEELLLDCLEIVRIRLEAGLSFHQAIDEMPILKIDKKLCRTWRKLMEKIENGRISATLALESLSENLRYKQDIQELRRQKSLNARFQSGVSLGIAVVFLLSSHFIFPPEIKPTWQMYLLSTILILIGFLWMQYFYRKFEENMWFGDWLLLLDHISYEMTWGQTLGQSLNDQQEMISKIPKDLKSSVENLGHALKSGQDPQWRPSPPQASSFLKIAFDHGRWIVQLLNQGLPVAQTLVSFSRSSRKSFERDLQKQGEMLSWKLMLPLFLCLMPSILVLLFGPILGVVFSM